MSKPHFKASLFPGLVAISTLTVLAVGCDQSSFKGEQRDASATKPEPAPGRTTSPGEDDANKKPNTRPTAIPTKGVCSAKRKAARIAFVVDNSGSNGHMDGTPAQAYETALTDPVRIGTTPFEKSGTYTNRQKALHELILEASRLDGLARSQDSSYLGTEVGIVSFPQSMGRQDLFGVHSGKGALPATMTNLKDAIFDASRSKALWSELKFTHTPGGMTPYLLALQGAFKLLKEERSDSDPREDHVILVTDGLPTDERPSLVLSARESLKNVKVHLINLRKNQASQEEAQDTAYKGLKEMFLKSHDWAVKPENTDGYSKDLAGYEKYWADLTAIPARISQTETTIETDELKQRLGEILATIQACP